VLWGRSSFVDEKFGEYLYPRSNEQIAELKLTCFPSKFCLAARVNILDDLLATFTRSVKLAGFLPNCCCPVLNTTRTDCATSENRDRRMFSEVKQRFNEEMRRCFTQTQKYRGHLPACWMHVSPSHLLMDSLLPAGSNDSSESFARSEISGKMFLNKTSPATGEDGSFRSFVGGRVLAGLKGNARLDGLEIANHRFYILSLQEDQRCAT